MAGQQQVVAWKSEAEWDQVLEYLYSCDTKRQREALHQISAWKSRRYTKLGVSVGSALCPAVCSYTKRCPKLKKFFKLIYT